MTPEKLAELNIHEKRRVTDAAIRARYLLPGPVGELVARELAAWTQFGYRLGCDKVVMQSVDWLHREWERQQEGRRSA